MKHSLFLSLFLCSAVVLTGCKSKESAYRQAYEKAKAQEMENGQNSNAEVVPVEEERPVVVTPVTPVAPPPARENNAVTDNSDVRTIAGGITVISGGPLKAYSVVVGSFWARERAEAMTSSLKDEGYNSCLVKTNETINGHTGWYRVIISSYDDKSSAAQLRSQLKNNKYPDAWLLYNK